MTTVPPRVAWLTDALVAPATEDVAPAELAQLRDDLGRDLQALGAELPDGERLVDRRFQGSDGSPVTPTGACPSTTRSCLRRACAGAPSASPPSTGVSAGSSPGPAVAVARGPGGGARGCRCRQRYRCGQGTVVGDVVRATCPPVVGPWCVPRPSRGRPSCSPPSTGNAVPQAGHRGPRRLVAVPGRDTDRAEGSCRRAIARGAPACAARGRARGGARRIGGSSSATPGLVAALGRDAQVAPCRVVGVWPQSGQVRVLPLDISALRDHRLCRRRRAWRHGSTAGSRRSARPWGRRRAG